MVGASYFRLHEEGDSDLSTVVMYGIWYCIQLSRLFLAVELYIEANASVCGGLSLMI